MKLRTLAICCMLAGVPVFSQVPDLQLKGPLDAVSFTELAAVLEQEYGLRVYFREEWVQELTFTSKEDSISLRTLLARHLYPQELMYTLESGRQLYVYPGRSLVDRLPVFVVQESGQVSDTLPEQVMEVEERYLAGRKVHQAGSIIVGVNRGSGTGRSVHISGRISNSESGEPVVGATMAILETGKGAISDQNGMVSAHIETGSYTLTFSFVGMRTETAILEVYDQGSFRLEMEPEVIALMEASVVGNYSPKVEGTVMGLERINVKAVKQIPVLMGEHDIIKISQLLPGIVSASEASTGVNVRGGYADQTVFYLEDIPLFNTSHTFGFFSTFTSDLIREFSIYKGNIPAMYGGRLSSVFDISARKGSLRNYTAHAGVSPISAHLTLDGPLVKDKASLLVSGRTSYSDWLLNRMEDPMIRNSSATFYDLSASLYYRIGEKDDLNLFFYNSRDSIGLHGLSKYRYENRGASLRWHHSYSPSLTSDLTAVYSSYRFRVESVEIPSTAYVQNYQIGHQELKLNFKWLKGLRHEVRFGGNVIYYPLDRGRVLPLGEESNRQEIELGKEQGLLTGLYVSDRIKLSKRLQLDLGLRYNYYSFLGPQEVYMYGEGDEKSLENVEEVLSYGKGESVVSHHHPVIRSGLNFKLGEHSSLKASYSQMRQYLFMASNTVTVAPDDQWKLADYHLQPQRSRQYSAGIYNYFPRWDLDASLEIYRKENDHVLEYKDGADFINIPRAEISLLQGLQRNHGAEFMLERKRGRYTGWLSYTYSRSLITVDAEEPWNRINMGRPYPSNYDKPHLLNFVGTFRVNRIYAFSTTVVYSTGRPITMPQEVYFYQDDPYIYFSSRNSERVPDYFRCDLSLTIEGNLKRAKHFHSTWIFSVYNVSGRDNAQSIFFRSEEQFIRGYQLSIIGVPIFTVTWNVKLGNYAAR